MNNTFCYICLIFVVIASEALLAATGQKPDPKAVLSGKYLYEKHCQVCHQKGGVGETQIPWGIRNPEYVAAMPLNETSHAWHHGDVQLVNMILNGIPGQPRMPARRHIITERDAHDIVAYIKSLWSSKILACQGPKHMSCM